MANPGLKPLDWNTNLWPHCRGDQSSQSEADLLAPQDNCCWNFRTPWVELEHQPWWPLCYHLAYNTGRPRHPVVTGLAGVQGPLPPTWSLRWRACLAFGLLETVNCEFSLKYTNMSNVKPSGAWDQNIFLRNRLIPCHGFEPLVPFIARSSRAMVKFISIL